MTRDDLQRHFLLALVIGAVALTVVLVSPFWSSLLVAAVLAAAARRPMEWTSARLRGRREVAAGLLVLVLILALALPIAALVTVVAGQAVEGFQWLRQALASEGVAGLIARLPSWLVPLVKRVVDAVPDLEAELQQLAGAGGGQAVSALGGLLAATGGALLRVGVTLVACWFFLVDGHRLVAWLEGVAPLAPGQFRELVGEFRRTAVSVLVATVATAAIQGAAALAGYLMAGAPGPLFLGTVTFLVALVPAVGGTVVVLAVAVLQLATGHPVAGAFLGAWGVGVVSMVDTLARPYLLKDGMDLPVGIVFLALLGGVAAFGVIGVLLGPLVVTFLIAALRLWRREQEAREAAEEPAPEDGRGTA
ncbi:MAG TPA: AI-2E family transporter [Anaeromyxobacteraceae bacterium]|nr:AI-2E family transporter [Anaeromyxobacteraceae bacterium]